MVDIHSRKENTHCSTEYIKGEVPKKINLSEKLIK